MARLFDVAVVGGGAAGLAAAHELVRRDRTVLVLEARDRIGGRIFTRREAAVPLPIELGAEFIHGCAPLTNGILRRARGLACDVRGEHWRVGRGSLRHANFQRPVDRILSRVDVARPDQSFSSFLDGEPGGRRLAPDRKAASDFVEGFHAADLAQISVRSIAPEKGARPTAQAATIARIVSGYDIVPLWLARDLRGRVQLQQRVEEVRWERGGVELSVRSATGHARVKARAVVITVPIGVLQASPTETGGLVFRPDPSRHRMAWNRIAMGSVIRLAVWFRAAPWALPAR